MRNLSRNPKSQIPNPKSQGNQSCGNEVLAITAALAMLLLIPARAQENRMNTLAEQYVRLVLAVGQHDADYVDAYYGPPAWRTEAESAKLPLGDIASRAAMLAQGLTAAKPPVTADELTRLRYQYLTRQLESLRARVSMLSGTKLRFDEESKALYDAVAPTHTEADFAKVLAQLDAALPGQGSLVDRYDAHLRTIAIGFVGAGRAAEDLVDLGRQPLVALGGRAVGRGQDGRGGQRGRVGGPDRRR